jgi:hypothetical protein
MGCNLVCLGKHFLSVSLETLEVDGITLETSGKDSFRQTPFLLVEMGWKEGSTL